MSEPSLFSWTPTAVSAWGTLVAAVGATVSAFFFLWDRFRPRPLQLLSNMEVRETVLPDAARADIYLASEVGEPMTIAAVWVPRGFMIASAQNLTAAKMKKLDFTTVKFTSRLRYGRALARDHSGEDPVVRIFIQADKKPPLRLFRRRPTLVVEGTFAFRRPARFELRVSPGTGSLRELVLKNTNKRQRITTP